MWAGRAGGLGCRFIGVGAKGRQRQRSPEMAIAS